MNFKDKASISHGLKWFVKNEKGEIIEAVEKNDGIKKTTKKVKENGS